MFTTLVFVSVAAVDFEVEVGRIRPALHSSGFGPKICSQTAQDLEDVKSMGFWVRTDARLGAHQPERTRV